MVLNNSFLFVYLVILSLFRIFGYGFNVSKQ